MCKSYDVIKVSVYYTIDLLNANNTIVCLRRRTIFFEFVLLKFSNVSFSWGSFYRRVVSTVNVVKVRSVTFKYRLNPTYKLRYDSEEDDENSILLEERLKILGIS